MSQSKKLAKKRKAIAPPPIPAAGAQVTTDGLTAKVALQNTSKLFEVLKTASEASDLLSPLKAIFGILKIVTDTAVMLQSNGEDLRDLIDKLDPQQKFIESEMVELSKPEFSKSNNVQGLAEPLQRYLSDLKVLENKLNTLAAIYNESSTCKRVKAVLKAQSDKDQIVGCTQKLEGSFRHFMNSVTSFIARQTLLMRDEMAALHDNMAVMKAGMDERAKTLADMKSNLDERDAKDALSKLAYVNARGNQHYTCTEGTRVNFLEQVAHWATDMDAKPIFTIVDRAGTGKSTIAAHMTRKWDKDGSLLARFFFSKPSTVTGKDLASTLARDIARSISSIRPLILGALEEHDDFTACSLEEQLDWLVFIPLKSLKERRVMVIDALDECSKSDRNIFLKSILSFISNFERGSCLLKVLLTSRPEDDIDSRLREPRYAESVHRAEFSLHSKENSSNDADVRLYMTRCLSNFLSEEHLEVLITRANGLFIWASTVQALIIKAFDPSIVFNSLMKRDSSLDSLYDEVLATAQQRAGNGQEDVLKKVLQAICAAREPLTADVMDDILGLPKGMVLRVVTSLSSVLSDGTHGAAVYTLHPTFLEHIQDPLKNRPLVLHLEAETVVAIGCLNILSSRLKYNICDIPEPGMHRKSGRNIDKNQCEECNQDQSSRYEEQTQQQLRKNTPSALLYATIHGISHVASTIHDEKVVRGLRDFFEHKLLNWIELVGFYQKLSLVMSSIHDLKTRIERAANCTLSANDVQWCNDILGMVQSFQDTIEESPMQVYFSALAFEPPTSNIARFYHPHFAGSIPKVVLGTRNADAQSLVLVGHQDIVIAITYSSDNRHLASGSHDGTVRLWDPRTGAAVGTLRGHTEPVMSLAFSPDQRHLASGSAHGTVQLWDTVTSEAILTLNRHPYSVQCLAFSLDGRHLGLGSIHRTVQLWDTDTGEAISTPSRYLVCEQCTKFFPVKHHLTSGSDDNTLRLCDADSTPSLNDRTDPRHALAFYPDRGHYTLCDWCTMFFPVEDDLISSPYIDTVPFRINPQPRANSMCWAFSSNGRHLAFSLYNSTIQLQGIVTGDNFTLNGHTGSVRCLAFSLDGRHLASGSDDGSVRVWDVNAGAPSSATVTHNRRVTSLFLQPHRSLWVIYKHQGQNHSIYRKLPVNLPLTLSIPHQSVTPHQITSLFKIGTDGWTSIPTARISFQLPSWFRCVVSDSYKGIVTFGGADGSIIVVDCTRLI